ncbi:MAG: hypothetical protein HZC12_06960 [Nitrospirae bacterium]|nr:hypothetical protein [Nitrospirota bacterium]
MDLLGLIRRHAQKRETGMLSVKLEGQEHLLKIYLNDGEITFISLGHLRNEECIEKIGNTTSLGFNFIEGMKPPKTSPVPLTEKLIGKADVATIMKEIVAGSMTVSPQKVKALEEDFVDTIGPIGSMLINDIYKEISYHNGSSMSGDDYNYLMESLIRELPESKKEQFRSKYQQGGRKSSEEKS